MSSLSSASTTDPFSSLYSDALSCVFGFLSLADLAAVTAVCQHWNAAASTMRSIGASIVEPSHRLYFLCATSLSRQIRSLGVATVPGRFDFATGSGISFFNSLLPTRLEIDPDTLAMCATTMTDLRQLHGRMVLPQRDRFVFPPRLNLLRVILDLESTVARDIVEDQGRAFIVAIAALPELVDLSLWFGGPHAGAISLAPLARMSQLRTLTLVWPWSASQVELCRDLRMLTQLETMRLKNVHWSLEQLLAPPHKFPWQDLGPLMGLNEQQTELITTLPLTSLDLVVTRGISIDFIKRLSGLRSLALDLRDLLRPPMHEAMTIMRTLPADLEAVFLSVPRLTALELCKNVMEVDQTQRVLQALPALTFLSLTSTFLGSWSFLRVQSLESKLRTLKLRGCDGGKEADLQHLHGLRALTALDLSDSAPLTPEAAPLYMVPSALMPGLRQFVFRLPRIRRPPPAARRHSSSGSDEEAPDEDAGISWEPIA